MCLIIYLYKYFIHLFRNLGILLGVSMGYLNQSVFLPVFLSGGYTIHLCSLYNNSIIIEYFMSFFAADSVSHSYFGLFLFIF